jgi:glycerol-3-phosphate O-acyltransferase
LDRLAASGFFVAHRTLRSFFDAQLVVAERLAAHPPGRSVDEEQLLAECIAVGRQMLLQGRLHSPESVSRELFGTAFQLAVHLGLVEPHEDTSGRAAWVAELRMIGSRISLAASLDASNRKEEE